MKTRILVKYILILYMNTNENLILHELKVATYKMREFSVEYFMIKNNSTLLNCHFFKSVTTGK